MKNECKRCYHRLALTKNGEASNTCELDTSGDMATLICFKRDIYNGLKPTGKMNDIEYIIELSRQGIKHTPHHHAMVAATQI